MVLVRAKKGINIQVFDPLTHDVEETKTVNGIFFLVSPENNPTQHLRILAKIAGRVDDDDFAEKWSNAKDEHELQEALLYDEQFLTLTISNNNKTKDLIDTPVRTIQMPEGCLITTIRRTGQTIVPKGNTILKNNDRLIIMGEPNGITELRKKYLR
jgi:Trk K+ transport system NAD-binding subunit